MSLLRDARFGFRLLVKNPGFAAVAVLTLALGIAATTGIFSVVYATYFEPLPYRDAERLAMVWSRHEGDRNNVSAQDLVEWRRQATVFEELNAWNGREVNLSTGTRPELILAGSATPGFLAMLGYGQPVFLGRNFLEEEGAPGRDQVTILSHRLWQDRFGGDPAVVGRAIRLDTKPYTVVGVLAPGPADHNMNRLYTPLVIDPAHEQHQSRRLLVMGRLKPGVTFAQANAEMAGVAGTLTRTYPDTHTGWTASVEPFRNNFVSDDIKSALWLLLGAVAFVLLIACTNVANLMLARGASRQRELAVRASLGASRAAVVCQLVTESLVLALVGGAAGVALAYALVDVIVALMPPFTLPTEVDIRLSVPVLLFTLAACTVSGVLFGAAPAWQAAHMDLNATLKDAGRSVAGGHHGFRRALVVLEFAVALTLLTGGGLAVRSFFRLATVDLGLRPERVLTFTLPMAQGRLGGPARIDAFYRDLVERVRSLPGVTAVSASLSLPMRPGQWSMPLSVAGRPGPDPSKRPQSGFNVVTPSFHETLGIRIVRGRDFTERDGAGSAPVAIVNEAFVRRHLPDVEPIGQRVVFQYPVPGVEGPGRDWEIVGVSADVRAGGPRNEGSPSIVLPFAQAPWPRPQMAVRAAGDPAALQDAIATVVASLDSDLPLGNVKTMEQLVSERMAGDRFNMALFGGFAAVALVLAAVGIYGVMAFVVAQRTREIGVRMALGAARGRVLSDVLREGMATAVAGTALGAAGAWMVARAMQGVLHGTPGLDPASFTAVAVTLLAAALAACFVPARRAASVDPMVAFRQE